MTNIRRKTVKVRVVDSTTWNKYLTPVGEILELLDEQLDQVPEGSKLIGWRTENERVTYEMPMEDFLAYAKRV